MSGLAFTRTVPGLWQRDSGGGGVAEARPAGLSEGGGGAVSVLDLAVPNIPGISLLRLFRILRVLRIFNRLRSLRAIVNALTASILPVSNAFAVMALITSVYAILGASLYGAAAPPLFGDFTSSLYTVRPPPRPAASGPPIGQENSVVATVCSATAKSHLCG